ncbi:MAG: hypothetical protein HC933_19850 [Pleurocapsa sp. SU_196_0]|nr:hypothetical protein [Pleurocapsa sp. SU_196_0]
MTHDRLLERSLTTTARRLESRAIRLFPSGGGLNFAAQSVVCTGVTRVNALNGVVASLSLEATLPSSPTPPRDHPRETLSRTRFLEPSVLKLPNLEIRRTWGTP